ncbi:flagellar hook-associated protein 1 [Escherichia coli]|uniref:Flagellar hook-associated protein 1 n=1 Tax=Escherichia coli TaxID=562 RepID=A0A377DE32_ECOLX|nr:flagellar hook-associated protein 1 [Escherichia coli]
MTPDANGKVAFDGLELTFTGTPAVNDSFTLKPVSDAIVNMDVLITDEAKIAMASEEERVIATTATVRPCWICKATVKRGGAKSFNDAYASLVSDIGNKTATLENQ